MVSPEYSILVAGVIGSAVIPTLIANAFYLPRHLLADDAQENPEPTAVVAATGTMPLQPASKAD